MGTVGCPGASFLGAIVDNDFTTQWCQWCLVEIEGTMDLGIGGQFGVDA
eukprot:CAMPEP_0168202804 /NCGR_PEP_ID=MMETSP0139_2-20121125/24494_1 /TAXON_ID=44445 /ORGANISM="Pseudo-nitzschia australis, Strain 10249 10 AB" /LENGTH=48 /DNA_ID= /DNA_START= /DNA_END= /DNA_ORIENTATION=